MDLFYASVIAHNCIAPFYGILFWVKYYMYQNDKFEKKDLCM